MKRLSFFLWLPVPLLLYWSLHGLDWPQVGRFLSRLTAPQIAVLTVVNLLFLVVLAARWGCILRALGQHLPLLRLVGYKLAGFAVSYLTPGPQFGGEPLQIVLARRRSALDYTTGSASILLDKSFELTGNFAFLAVGAAAAWALPGIADRRFTGLLAIVSALALLPLGYLLATARGFRPLTRLAGLAPRPLRRTSRHTRLLALLGRAECAVADYGRRRGRLASTLLLFFLLVWGLAAAETALVLRFMGLALNWRELIVVLAAGKLAFLLPLPGAWGALEAAQRLLFTLLGQAPEAALSLVVYIRARDLLLVLVGLAVIARRPRHGPGTG